MDVSGHSGWRAYLDLREKKKLGNGENFMRRSFTNSTFTSSYYNDRIKEYEIWGHRSSQSTDGKCKYF
jgi:hypothetical protein